MSLADPHHRWYIMLDEDGPTLHVDCGWAKDNTARPCWALIEDQVRSDEYADACTYGEWVDACAYGDLVHMRHPKRIDIEVDVRWDNDSMEVRIR